MRVHVRALVWNIWNVWNSPLSMRVSEDAGMEQHLEHLERKGGLRVN